MRIVAGSLKGRRLQGPAGNDVRPTSDRLRETLFNVLGARVQGVKVVDAFAGTGAVGLEALSRGASHVTFYERNRAAWALTTANVAACHAEGECHVVRGDFLRSAGKQDCGLVFLDPPYDDVDLDGVLRVAAAHRAPDGIIVLEHRRSRDAPALVDGLRRTRVLNSGDSALSFYS